MKSNIIDSENLRNGCMSLSKPVETEVKNTYQEEQLRLEYIVGEILCKNNLTVATAESCTGGMVASKLISYPGISQVFLEGAVTYSNEAKIKRLGVKIETLNKYGAVSEETAREMAKGIAIASGSDIGIATTGIAGPGGGTEEKPVGLVYIGVYIKGRTIVSKFIFKGDREEVRVQSSMNALDLLKRELINNN